MDIHENAVLNLSDIQDKDSYLIEHSVSDKVLKNRAISAIMDMHIQDVVKYLSYIKNGEI